MRYESIKKTLERHKKVDFPEIPISIQNLQTQFQNPDIINKYAYTLDGDARFYIDTVIKPDYAFTMFASYYVIESIGKYIPPESRNYLLDATFDKLPPGFYQMLIIAIEYKNNVSVFIRFLSVRPFARPPVRPSARSKIT